MSKHISLNEYKKSISSPLALCTLCFLVKDNHILLAMKKRGFGEGKWNGVGGKKNDSETIEECAIRETREEIGVNISEIEKVATLDFYTPHKPAWNQRVLVFLVKEWEGEPEESEEMKPQWFDQEKIPFEDMWPDDSLWLGPVLEGKKLKAEFLFDENTTIVEHIIEAME